MKQIFAAVAKLCPIDKRASRLQRTQFDFVPFPFREAPLEKGE